MHDDRTEQLTVEVQLMADPSLWCWEIRDESHGCVLENSWTGEWTAYESPEEAYRAAQARLRSLAHR
ncbi:MAG TPA: hypothetical protein VGL09_17590 [Methylomirabilota bacterium]|jgi:hypothetical protein